eukprot:Lithocolla_globosa_v1_NODE_309_length_4559_cov_14.810169.p5 type:complete len:130 gc:universal NODE_309_length_4559_cov_14.810169:3478-3089(-)
MTGGKCASSPLFWLGKVLGGCSAGCSTRARPVLCLPRMRLVQFPYLLESHPPLPSMAYGLLRYSVFLHLRPPLVGCRVGRRLILPSCRSGCIVPALLVKVLLFSKRRPFLGFHSFVKFLFLFVWAFPHV